MFPIVEANLASRFDEQICTGEVAEDCHEDGWTVAAHPHGRGDCPEQRDERQRVTHQGVEQQTEKYSRHKGGDRRRVGCPDASAPAPAPVSDCRGRPFWHYLVPALVNRRILPHYLNRFFSALARVGTAICRVTRAGPAANPRRG